jgi:sn-glycerol 3-phosphate transport system ATP-binding protein
VVNRLEPGERDIAMVFQNYALYPHMTVRKNMEYGLKNQGMPKPRSTKRIAEAARTLQIEQYLDRKPRALSGGQRQRVAMGRAIVREPAVFLFDEPLSNLDAKLRTQLRAELKDLHQRLGATFVFVTHDQVEAMSLADRIVIMSEGKVEQIGTPMELYRTPASRFVAEFIGAPPMNVSSSSPGGQALAALAGGVPKGAKLAGIRPEALHISREGPSGDVILVEALGAESLIHLRMGEDRMILRGGHDSRTVEGQTLHVGAESGAITFFDANERAMENGAAVLIATASPSSASLAKPLSKGRAAASATATARCCVIGMLRRRTAPRSPPPPPARRPSSPPPGRTSGAPPAGRGR